MLANWPHRSAVLVKTRMFKEQSPQDTLQRDIREWTQTQRSKGKATASPKAKVKGKAKARDNIQGTTTRTKLDLRMKKRDSAGRIFCFQTSET